MTPRLLTADEVAEMLRVDKSWVYSATRANRIPHIRLGRYVRYSDLAIEQWLTDIQGDCETRVTQKRA
jgi:excisionase family DNA binding protein